MGVIRGGLLTRKEKAIGVIDGVNKSFTTTFSFIPSTLEVFLNGLKLITVDHFNETGSNSFDMVDAPIGGLDPDDLTVRYQRA